MEGGELSRGWRKMIQVRHGCIRYEKNSFWCANYRYYTAGNQPLQRVSNDRPTC